MEDKLPYAAFFELLSLSFKCPDARFCEIVRSGEYRDAYLEIAGIVGLDQDVVDQTSRVLEDMEKREADELLHELRVEYTRLFVGAPHSVVSLSEGVWRARKRGDTVVLAVINNTTISVEQYMKSCGVFASKTNREPIDNIDTECDFMQYLLTKKAFSDNIERTPDQAYAEFLREHMSGWVPGFAEQVEQATQLDWYKALAKSLGAYVRLLVQDLESASESA